MPEEKRLYRDFGRLVKAHRKRLKMTQEQLAILMHLSRTSVTNIERGRQKVLLHQLFNFAAHLRVGAEALLPQVSESVDAERLIERLPKDMPEPERRWVARVVGPLDSGGDNDKE